LFCVERIVDGLALIISLKSSWLHWWKVGG
jgi:hypothetical protein